MRLLTIMFLSAMATSAVAQTVPVEPFRSVELRNGGRVIVRHGETQRVRLLSGNLDNTRIRVVGDRLVIDTGRRHDRMQLEVITPPLSAVAVSNGGILQSDDSFPAQAEIQADVEQGGTVDISSIPVDVVDASVYSGGRIYTDARQALTAAVDSGGIITYLENPRVRKSIRHGGVVAREKSLVRND